MKNERKGKQKIISKMHHDNCIEYRKNKNKQDNEYNKPKYHTDDQRKRIEYLKNLRNDAKY